MPERMRASRQPSRSSGRPSGGAHKGTHAGAGGPSAGASIEGQLDGQGALALQGLAGNEAVAQAVQRQRAAAGGGAGRTHRPKGAGGPDVYALIKAQAPALLGVLAPEQVEQLQKHLDVQASNEEVRRRHEATYASWQNRYNLDPMGFGDARRELEGIAGKMQPEQKGPVQVEIPTASLLARSLDEPPTWNVEAETRFRTWVKGKLLAQPTQVRIQDINGPSIDYYVGNEYVPSDGGLITLASILRTQDYATEYREQVSNGPHVRALRDAMWDLQMQIIEVRAGHEDLSKRNKEHKYIRKVAEAAGAAGPWEYYQTIRDAEKHPEKGSVAERLRQLQAPYPSIRLWEAPQGQLDRADKMLREGKVELAAATYGIARGNALTVGGELARYERKAIGGAGTVVKWLERAKTAGTISVGVLTGGYGAVASAAATSAYVATQETAQQVSEIGFGQRKSMDALSIAGRAGVEGLLSMLGGVAQGKFVAAITARVGARLTTAVGKEMSEAAISAAGSSLSSFYTAPAGVVLNAIANGQQMPKSLEEFADLVAKQATEGAAMDLLLRPLGKGAEAERARRRAAGTPQQDGPTSNGLGEGQAPGTAPDTAAPGKVDKGRAAKSGAKGSSRALPAGEIAGLLRGATAEGGMAPGATARPLLSEAAIRKLLARGGKWEVLIADLQQGRGVGDGLSDGLRSRMVKELVAHRQRFTEALKARFPVEEKGTASTEAGSDVDLQVGGDRAGADLLRIRGWLDANHPGWRDHYRMALLVEGTRLTTYESPTRELPARERARVEASIVRETELLALSRRLRYTPPDGWAPLMEHLPTADRARVRDLASMGGEPRKALHDRLLLEADAVVAKLRAATDPRERARLAIEVTRKQMVANSLSDDAYVGPGTFRAIVGGERAKGAENARRQYQNVEDQLAFLAKEVHGAKGKPEEAMRGYEAFKYINRACVALREAGISDHRLPFLENWSSLVYRADRSATARGGAPEGRGYKDLPEGYQKATVRIHDPEKAVLVKKPEAAVAEWRDEALLRNYRMFQELIATHEAELRRLALRR